MTALFYHAQLYKGTVSFWDQTGPCTFRLNADSSFYFVWADAKNKVYNEYSGSLKNLNGDLCRLHTRKPVRREGWGLYDEATGQIYRHAQVLIDTFHKKTFAPVYVVYADGSRQLYPFKGQMKLDTNKLNAKHPSYKLVTQHKNQFTKKALTFAGTYTSNICFLYDTAGVDVFVRFKKDSLVTVPDGHYLRYNYFFRLRQEYWKPAVTHKNILRTFTYPDISGWRLDGDSLVYSDDWTIAYGTDTVHTKEVRQYLNGKFISSYEVSRKNKLTDSSLYMNIFDDKGKLKGLLTRWFSEQWCDSSINPNNPFDEEMDHGEKINLENIHYACPRYAYTTIDYQKDSIGVKRSMHYNHQYRTLEISSDTTWYHANGLKRLERSYTDTTLNYTWRHHYQYDENRKLKLRSGRITHNNGYEVSQLDICLGIDTVNIKSTTRYRADSTSGEYIIYKYDPQTKISWFKCYYNGEVARYSVSLPAPQGCVYGSVTMTFDKDSVLTGTKEVYCVSEKKTKGTSERWSTGRDQSYTRSDTVKTQTGYLVKTYSSHAYMVYPDFKSPDLNTLQLVFVEQQDVYRRTILLIEYTNDNTVKRKVRYSYSQP